MQRLRRFAIDQGGALALAVAVFYVLGACPYIVENDNAEFATLGAAGGIAHPSGYPAYVLWLRAWSWLPVSSPAHAAAIATAILGVLQVLVLHAACRAWGARPLAATLAVGVYAVAPLVARYNTSAEAFAMNGLVVALVLWLAAANGPARGMLRAGLLGLVAGLGLANHLTCAVAAPVGLLGVVRAVREAGPLRSLPIAIGGLALGLGAYLYLLIAPDHLASWRHPENLSDIVAIVLREDYGGMFGFSGSDAALPWAENLAELARTLGRSWLWILPVGGLAALGVAIARPRREPRAGWIALAATIVLAGPLLVTRFDIPLDVVGLWTVRRFHLLPILLFVIPIALALELAAARYEARLAGRLPAVLVVLVVLAATIASMPYLRRFRSPAMDYEVRNTLASLPQHAVLIGGVDELDVGIRYLQLACGERTDVTVIRWQTINWDWYAAKLAPFHYDKAKPFPRRQLIEQAFARGLPVFVKVGIDKSDLDGLGRYPYGIVDRVLPPGAPMPTLDEVVTQNRDLFAKFRLDYAFPGRDDEWATWMHFNYEAVWRRLAGSLARAGNAAGAAAARDLAAQLAPR